MRPTRPGEKHGQVVRASHTLYLSEEVWRLLQHYAIDHHTTPSALLETAAVEILRESDYATQRSTGPLLQTTNLVHTNAIAEASGRRG